MIRPSKIVAWIARHVQSVIQGASFRRAVSIIFFGAVLAALLLVTVLFVPEWLVVRAGIRTAVTPEAIKPAELAALQNERIKIALQAVGGIFAIIALWYTYRRVKVSEEGQITDRFTKAIEQLGALTAKNEPNIEVRLGAIYALERIAQDSPRDHWTIMEVLTAYVRRNAPAPDYVRQNTPAPVQVPTDRENEKTIAVGPSTEIQAILTVLGRRKRDHEREQEGQSLDLQKSDLRGANFQGLHLEGANFHLASVEGARFYYAYMEKALFITASVKGASFQNAHLEGAQFDMAHVEGAWFDDAHVEGAHFDYAYVEGARFFGAYLEGASFRYTLGHAVGQFEPSKGKNRLI
jgi:hypothetical protein